jgi:hypothetical protein
MADTKEIKTRIEPYVREWLSVRFSGHKFNESPVSLITGGIHKFDIVSNDGLIVGDILCNRAKTRTGRENTGAVRKAQNDIQLLKLLPAKVKRLMVFTDNEFCGLIHRRASRLGIESIETVVCTLPSDLQKRLIEILDKASYEQKAAE